MAILEIFKKRCLNADRVTEERLLSLLKENADTEYGKLYDFKAINSVSDYKRRVPFTEFKDYEDAVRRMTHGEKNILTAYPIAFYAHTSGTLGAAKFIPVSEKAEEIQHMYRPFPSEVYAEFLGGKPMNKPDHPKVLYLITARGSSAPDGTLITNFSGRLAFEQKEAVMNTAVKPELIFCTEQMDIMYLFAFYALKERELFHIGAPFMSAISDFFCYIRNHWEKLCRDIGEGILRPDVRTSDSVLERLNVDLTPDPQRAEELYNIFSKGFDKPIASDIWPYLCSVRGIGAASFSSYTKIVQSFIGDIPIYMSMYAASEGVFGVAIKMNAPEYVMIPQAGYFEFIPEKDMQLPETELMERTLGMNELQIGERYEMVVTNLSGFYRYRIGDVVTVNGYFGRSPVICFAYRRHQILNVVGEKTHEDMMIYAINGMKEQTGINVVEWSVCADQSTSPARYMIFMETDPEVDTGKKQEMRDILEEKLSKASEYYHHYIQENKLGPMELVLLQAQTYALYRDIQVWNGASPNQLKPVHIINDPKTKAFFCGLKR